MATQLLVIVPTFNEEAILERNVLELVRFFEANPTWDAKILIADSSHDRTPQIAESLSARNPGILLRRFPAGAGKGHKLRLVAAEAPRRTPAELYAFLDADLPISFEDFLAILENVRGRRANLSTATRHAAGSRSVRPLHRKVLSAAGNALFNLALRLPVSDFLAGAKAWDNQIATRIWPLVEDDLFFFDIQLLFIAHRHGFRIAEVPVRYVDLRVGADSKAALGLGTLAFAGQIAALLARHGSRGVAKHSAQLAP